MDHHPRPETVAGHRRRRDDPAGEAPVLARWPLDVDDDFHRLNPRDPYVAIVREAIASYRRGECELARRSWAEDITWTIEADGPLAGRWVGPDAIFDLHRTLEEQSNGTFRQGLVGLLASGGPIVEAHVRTTATRNGHQLDQPSLLVFEVGAGRLRRVIEIPGDRAAWGAFWSV
jgi:ketosteroid isomerase-like protein